jgi:hypothetical protein
MMIFFMSRTLAPLGTKSVIRLWPSCEKDVKAGSRTRSAYGCRPSRERLVELVSQPRDIDVDRPVRLPVALLPDRAVQLLAGHDAIAALGQRREQLELSHGEAQRVTGRQGQVLGGADLDLSNDHGTQNCHPNPQTPLFQRCRPVKSL